MTLVTEVVTTALILKIVIRNRPTMLIISKDKGNSHKQRECDKNLRVEINILKVIADNQWCDGDNTTTDNVNDKHRK